MRSDKYRGMIPINSVTGTLASILGPGSQFVGASIGVPRTHIFNDQPRLIVRVTYQKPRFTNGEERDQKEVVFLVWPDFNGMCFLSESSSQHMVQEFCKAWGWPIKLVQAYDWTTCFCREDMAMHNDWLMLVLSRS